VSQSLFGEELLHLNITQYTYTLHIIINNNYTTKRMYFINMLIMNVPNSAYIMYGISTFYQIAIYN